MICSGRYFQQGLRHLIVRARQQQLCRFVTQGAVSDFHYKIGEYRVSTEMKQAFNKDGYVLVRQILDREEIGRLCSALEADSGIVEHSYEICDGEGGHSRLCIWNHPGHDITGMIARSEKVAGTMEMLLGGEVYHYHSKLMMKEAFTGGSFAWHQDYGYWYQNGCLFPNMATAFIAIDRCDEDNGCMEVVRGSNHLGRVNHGRYGGQTGADLQRVSDIKQILPVDRVVLDPGDVAFFHCNLLHKSNKNRSPRRRWAMLCAYNMASNNPIIEHHCPQYTPLLKVPDSAVRDCSTTDTAGKDFMNPLDDKTVELKS